MKKIVCHGDSLTEAADVEKNLTWTALVENHLNVKVINSGIGGDTTAGLVGRFYPDVVRHQPNIVLILAGTNDLWWDLDINTIQANIYAMTCQAQYHDIAPVVGLPLPMMVDRARKQEFMEPVAGYEKCIKKLAELVDALSNSASKSDIPCLDFYHPFFDKKGNVIGKLFLEDGLHPNKDGNKLMAAQTVEFLRKLFYFS